MTIFLDDFARADGALGNNWANAYGTMLIAGGSAGSGQPALAYQTTISDSGRLTADAWVLQGPTNYNAVGPAVKCAAGQNSSYMCMVQVVSSNRVLQLCYQHGTTFDVLASSILGSSIGPYYHLYIEWDHGHLKAMWNDSHLIEADHVLASGQNYPGLYVWNSNGCVDRVVLVGGASPALGLAPMVIPNYGACSTVSLSGVNTNWTPGTPGAPIFTVDHGTISAQTVVDSAHATITYCPGTYLGAVTFTDPSTGMSVGGIVSSDPAIVPPSGGGLSQTALDYIERSAIAESGGTIVNREQQINAFAGLQTLTETITTINAQVTDPGIPAAGIGSLLGFVIEIFDLINGGNNWGGAATVFGNTSLIKSGVDDANTAISDMRGAGGVTLATLAAALSNLRGVGQPSLADVLSAISTPDLGPISEKLDAMRGDTTTSLYTLLSSLAGIRTVGAYSLGDVRQWIGTPAQAKPDATALAVGALLLALLAAPETGGASLAVLAAAEGAGPVLDVATLVELVSVAGELAGVVKDIAELKAKPVSGYTGAPVWPGASLVNLGTSASLGARGTISEAMDGVVVDIDHADTDHKPAYSYDGALAWRNIGCLAFADDQGRLEGYQPFCFAHQTFTPKSLRRAASVRWFTGHGPIGTLRAWTVKP